MGVGVYVAAMLNHNGVGVGLETSEVTAEVPSPVYVAVGLGVLTVSTTVEPGRLLMRVTTPKIISPKATIPPAIGSNKRVESDVFCGVSLSSHKVFQFLRGEGIFSMEGSACAGAPSRIKP